MLSCPTNLCVKKTTLDFPLRISEFYFLFSATPTGFLTFCLPADEATTKSVTKYSPTDSEKQTAVVCKDNGLCFFDKAPALSKTIHISQDPTCVCDIDNMNSNTTNKTRTGPKCVRTQEPEAEQETPTTTPPPPPPPPRSAPSLPTKAAKNALELAVASLPTSVQPLILNFGHQIITARCKRYTKKSIMQ